MFAVMFSEMPLLLMKCDFTGVRPHLLQLGKNLLMVQSWFPENAHSFNTVGWFLSVLMFLYALSLPFAWLLSKLNSGKYRWIWITGLFGGIFCGIVFYCYMTQDYDMSFWHYQFPPARAGEYFLGMIMGFVSKPIKEKIPSGKIWKVVFTVLEIGVLLFWYYSLSRPGNYWRNNIVSWLIPNLAVLAVFLAGRGLASELFRKRPFVYLGDISFECYLLHQLILIRFAVNLVDIPVSAPGKVFVFLFSLLFSVLLASYLNGMGKQKKTK
jgi:peptidoglycan/LPS O-acetylase OafA/YrhL